MLDSILKKTDQLVEDLDSSSENNLYSAQYTYGSGHTQNMVSLKTVKF